MSKLVQVGPNIKQLYPHQSVGVTFYNKLRTKEPNSVILIDDATGEEITYGKLLSFSVAMAVSLRKLGVKKADVITIISQNNWKYVVSVIAGFYIGAKVNLLNHDFMSNELKHFLGLCQPVLILCTTKALENIFELQNERFFPKNIVLYDGDDPSEQIINFDELLKGNDEKESFVPVDLDPKEDVAVILTSSGTTGLPKLVMLTHANYRTIVTYAGDPQLFDLNEKKSTIGYLPFFHVFGLLNILGGTLHGAKCVILDKFNPERFLKIIEDHRITTLFVVPTIVHFLAKSPLTANYDVSSIKNVVCGGAMIGKELEEMVEQRLNIKCFRQGYGLTETAAAGTLVPKYIKKSGSVGKPLNTVKIKVCDVDTGKALPANQVGELRILSDVNMKGYLGNVEETVASFDQENYLKTGDLGYYDEEGFFYIVDRLKEIIKYKGFQVSPTELENLLIKHPSIKDAGIVGIPHERDGEVPLALVVKQPYKNITEEDVVRYVKENVSSQKHLHGGVKFVEEIPRSASGKILRRKLKNLLQTKNKSPPFE